MAETTSQDYTIERINKEDADNVMNLLKKTFFVNEPLNEAIGLCNNGTCLELEEYCTKSLFEGLSFKAVDRDGQIVGVMISGISPLKEADNGNDLLSQAKRCKNTKFQKILYILAQREKRSKLWEKFPQHQRLVEVKVAATDPKWQKRGIMKELLLETEKITKERGINLLRMDTSSAYSAMSAERLGFTCVYKAFYRDIKMDETPLIVPQPPHVDDRVYVKELTSP